MWDQLTDVESSAGGTEEGQVGSGHRPDLSSRSREPLAAMEGDVIHGVSSHALPRGIGGLPAKQSLVLNGPKLIAHCPESGDGAGKRTVRDEFFAIVAKRTPGGPHPELRANHGQAGDGILEGQRSGHFLQIRLVGDRFGRREEPAWRLDRR